MSGPTNRVAPRRHLPAGYERDDNRPDVFDPALKHHDAAFIKGPPRFEDPAEAARFREARARILRRCLAGIGRMPVGEQVVARGSVVLELWYGERARPAKDIDLVVTPAAVGPNSSEGQRLMAELTRAVTEALRLEGTELDPASIPVDGIWTYERAEGRRLTFPWTWEGRVRDSVQVDVVFNEQLFGAPLRHTVEGVEVQVATPEESLAWKLLWLANDLWPQGKDLYDAVLLAENTRLTPGFLQRVFDAKQGQWHESVNTGTFETASQVDWPNFVLEHPTLAGGTLDEFRARLERALQRGV
ncbi:nucleotidyl transferase AbiEii/AbiGii toxin family protein [Corallococcus exercitus]|uniref:Nucleotidyl transferase AbiEii/AbiGii toxin family protein n=1 Tax=Corallococcus exercitus TaxID=2316736 RepID=A0A3A8IB33_9BACT|nr:nucleotidyl transferase AbiEii/AbiGii toxin family protein [Corallococcus exercitus]NOK31941.1 nucleotidyl transferase AbiEii/AbiGii toxin family protein [Corallococcus exercitus]RKG76990.1 nucleotidyl transferase AbiEii/AbiGii toxin family protein [Corallococcus exercitus]